MMQYKIAQSGTPIKYLLDRILFNFIDKMSRRSLKNHKSVGPLCASTSDLITHRLISTGSFENLHLDALDVLLNQASSIPGLTIDQHGTFVDVGANIGIFSIRYSPYFTNVIAVEANPITYQVLSANIAMRQCSNVQAICVGASNVSNSAPIKVDKGGNLGWSSLHDSLILQDRATFTVDIKLEPLDNIVGIAPGTRVSLLKLDIEGHEAAALEGARTILRNHRPAVLYEKNESAGSDPCAEILMAEGYNRFVIFKRKINSLMPFSKSEVMAYDVEPDKSGTSALILCFCDDSIANMAS